MMATIGAGLRVPMVTACLWLALAGAALSQAYNGLDMASPKMTTAELSRADVEALIAVATTEKPVDLSQKSLNGIDLSGLNLTGANFRASYLNATIFAGAKLDRARFDQAWALKADFSRTSMRNATLFQSQAMDAVFDRADLSGARLVGDFSRASMLATNFSGADFSADMRNQSMGMMRGVLNSAKLQGADFTGANLSRASLEFADLTDASLEGANLLKAEANGANFSGTNVEGADFADAELQSATVATLKGKPLNWEKAKGLRKLPKS